MVSSSSSSSATILLPDTSNPLPSHTFAGMVEHALFQKFAPGSNNNSNNSNNNNNETTGIERIITSWRLLEQDYEHHQELFVGQSKCYQHCHSYVPGLTIRQFWDCDKEPSMTSWTNALQKQYQDIRTEFQRVAITDPETLQQQGNNIWASALTQDASSYGADWKTLVLCDRGVWDPVGTVLRKPIPCVFLCAIYIFGWEAF
jgi:hypothetical protein